MTVPRPSSDPHDHAGHTVWLTRHADGMETLYCRDCNVWLYRPGLEASADVTLVVTDISKEPDA